jgi:hypothetical protein
LIQTKNIALQFTNVILLADKDEDRAKIGGLEWCHICFHICFVQAETNMETLKTDTIGSICGPNGHQSFIELTE